ncbi:MAG TPA: hypothetical protein VK655_02625 [Solirubrobacteraceae bacterium]|jgi:hypothetical protein|nr:hypothetical protein [Solirubrobacteraceae bacterium]
MNTVRVPTSFDVERGPVATYARMILLAVVLCVAVFAGSFALGRSQRPASTPREQLASSVSTASAGPAIPVRLASSPPVATSVTAAPARPARAQFAKTVPAPDASQAALASAPSTPTVEVATPAVPVSAPAKPTPAPVSAPPVSRAPAQTSPAPSQRAPSSSGAGKSESGGSTSFDSSG